MPRRRPGRRPRRARGAQRELLSPTFKTSPYSEPKTINLRTGQVQRDLRARPKKSKGPAVNPRASEPRSPGPGVDAEGCTWCGEVYDDWRSSCSWDSAAETLYDGTYDPDRPSTKGSFYRSRGPILWRLRVCKLGEWYARHRVCVELGEELGQVRLDPPLFWQVAHGSGCLSSADLVNVPKRTQRKLEQTAGWICGGPQRQDAIEWEPPPGMTRAEWADQIERWEQDQADDDEPIPF